MRAQSNDVLRKDSPASLVRATVLLLLGVSTWGCTALVDGKPGGANASGMPGQGGSAAGGSANTGGASTVPPNCTEPSPGSAPIRRLTRFELNNTLRDLLGDATKAANQLPAEIKGNGFSNDAATLTTTRQLVDAYRSIASTVAATATADATTLAKLTTCDVAAQGEDACAHKFVADFGQKAYRRPLTDPEGAGLFTAYTAGRADGGTYAAGLSAVIEMALQAPQFLYRIEVGVPVAGKSIRRPTSTEMATRLSYSLWGSLPDAPLLAVATGSGLDTPEQIKAEAQQMLQDPRAHDMLHFFADTLYGIGASDALVRDKTAFPTYDTSLGPCFVKRAKPSSMTWCGTARVISRRFGMRRTRSSMGLWRLSMVTRASAVTLFSACHATQLAVSAC
jgi:hypothetical protein